MNLTPIGCIKNIENFNAFSEALPRGSTVQGSAANKKRGYSSQDRIFAAGKEGGVRHYLFGVADGHGGDEASEYLSSQEGIPYLIEKAMNTDDATFSASRLVDVCLLANQQMHKVAKTQAGSTLTGVLSVDDNRDVFVFNVADSPAFVVMRNGDVFKTINHDATNPAEIARFRTLDKHSTENVYYDEQQERFMFVDEKRGSVCGLQPSRDFGLGVGQTEAFEPSPYVYKVRKDEVAFVGVLSDGPVDSWSGVGRLSKTKDVSVDFIEDLMSRSLKQKLKKSVLTNAQLDRVASSYLSSFDDDMSIIFKKFQDPIINEVTDSNIHSRIDSREVDRPLVINKFERPIDSKGVPGRKYFPTQSNNYKLKSAEIVGCGALSLLGIALSTYTYYKI